MKQTSERAVQAEPRVTLGQTVFSVLASFFGVQSTRNWARDFTHGNAWTFIGVGLLLTTGFVFTMLLVVRVVLRSAGM
ncbi:MAG: DUF2970 domain-containing protein [Nevskia sp.]|nr:DUF2970 domain-containing protein [Nevskia sp.]